MDFFVAFFPLFSPGSFLNVKEILLQARLELATPAWLDLITVYKYRALTDCATGAIVSSVEQMSKQIFEPSLTSF